MSYCKKTIEDIKSQYDDLLKDEPTVGMLTHELDSLQQLANDYAHSLAKLSNIAIEYEKTKHHMRVQLRSVQVSHKHGFRRKSTNPSKSKAVIHQNGIFSRSANNKTTDSK